MTRDRLTLERQREHLAFRREELAGELDAQRVYLDDLRAELADDIDADECDPDDAADTARRLRKQRQHVAELEHALGLATEQIAEVERRMAE